MQNKNYTIIILLIIAMVLTAKYMISNHDNKLKIVLVMPPLSVDPMDYDYSIHHNTMRSVFASLISEYKKGEFAPQVASHWKANLEKTEWVLKIDKAWTFENGDRVTPAVVLRNFKRVLIIKNKLNSKSGLLEYLIASDKMTSFSDEIEGLTVTDSEIFFKFIKPMPDFLDKVSFGLYSIAHPQDYDDNAEWKNKKKAISSGYYKITGWDDKKLSLRLRDNLHPENISDKNIKNVDFIFPNDLSNIEDAKMIFSDRLNPKLDESEWHFASSTLDNKIIYIQVMKWDDKSSIYSDKLSRQKLRDVFYRNLEKAGMIPQPSFFPLSLKGVTSFPISKNVNFNFNKKTISTQPFTVTNYKNEHRKKSQGDIFAEAYYDFCLDVNGESKINEYPEKSEDEKKVFDIQYLGTGISIDNPKEDIRFMFKSAHGIMLPDESGKIIKMLDSDFAVQDVNSELWDQAIIWPVKHYSSGFWYRKDSDLDISNLNILLTPTDLQFLKWK